MSISFKILRGNAAMNCSEASVEWPSLSVPFLITVVLSRFPHWDAPCMSPVHFCFLLAITSSVLPEGAPFFCLQETCWASQWHSGKESACNAGDARYEAQSLGWEDPLWEGNGNPLQYSCLGYPMDRGAWQATVHGFTKNQTWLSDQARDVYISYRCNLMIHKESSPIGAFGK